MFGDVEITDGIRTLKEVDLHSRQVLRLMVYLFGSMERQVSDSELIDSLWEKEIANPSNALRNLVYRLRKAFAAVWPDVDFILTGTGLHYINPDLSIELDARKFQKIVSLCVNPNGQSGSIWDMARAASLYRGKFVKNLGDFGWSQYVQAWFSEQYVLLTDRLCGSFLEKGLPYHAEYWIIRAVKLEPEDERLHEIYLRIYLAQHKMEEARKLFQTIVHTYFEDGMEPLTEELEQIHAAYFPDINVGSGSLKDIMDAIHRSRTLGPVFTRRSEFNKIVLLEERRLADAHEEGQVMLIRLLSSQGDISGAENSLFEKAQAHLVKCLTACLRKFDDVTKIDSKEYLILLPNCGRKQGEAIAKRIEDYFLRFFGWGATDFMALQYEIEDCPAR